MKLDIGKATRALFDDLKTNGFGGMDLYDLTLECLENWGEDYGVFCGLTWDFDGAGEYFDNDRYQQDIEEHIRGAFAGDPTVVVNFHWGCQEVEVHRKDEQEKPRASLPEVLVVDIQDIWRTSISRTDAAAVVKALAFIQTLSSPDLVLLAESFGRLGSEFVELCRELKAIQNRLED